MEELSDEHLAYIWAEQRLTSSHISMQRDVDALSDPTRDSTWNRFSIAIANMETASALLSASIEAIKAMSLAADDREMSAWLLRAKDTRSSCLELYRHLANTVAPKVENALDKENTAPEGGSE